MLALICFFSIQLKKCFLTCENVHLVVKFYVNLHFFTEACRHFVNDATHSGDDKCNLRLNHKELRLKTYNASQ